MFIIKFFASIFFIIFLLAMLFLVIAYAWVRNIKRQFERLGKNKTNTRHQHTADTQQSSSNNNHPTVNDNEGEYVDFEEIDENS